MRDLADRVQKKVIYRKIVSMNHFLLSVFLAVFFIYAGIKKFIPKPHSRQVNNEEFIKAFEENRFESPVTFRMGIKALKASKFLLMVGVLQILAGILIIVPRTRLVGLLVLLPVAVNIFCFHVFMDNNMDENIETGILLGLNMVLLTFYFQKLKSLLVRESSLRLVK